MFFFIFIFLPPAFSSGRFCFQRKIIYHLLGILDYIFLLCLRTKNIKMELGLQLKSIRKIKGYTQKQVCDEVGMSQTYLSHVETGKVNVSSNLLNFMCWFYKVPPQFVYWKTLKDTDVPLRKRKQFKQLNPVMLSLIDTIIKEKP